MYRFIRNIEIYKFRESGNGKNDLLDEVKHELIDLKQCKGLFHIFSKKQFLNKLSLSVI